MVRWCFGLPLLLVGCGFFSGPSWPPILRSRWLFEIDLPNQHVAFNTESIPFDENVGENEYHSDGIWPTLPHPDCLQGFSVLQGARTNTELDLTVRFSITDQPVVVDSLRPTLTWNDQDGVSNTLSDPRIEPIEVARDHVEVLLMDGCLRRGAGCEPHPPIWMRITGGGDLDLLLFDVLPSDTFVEATGEALCRYSPSGILSGTRIAQGRAPRPTD